MDETKKLNGCGICRIEKASSSRPGRRIGKTSIMRKMLENPGEGWAPIFVLVESVQHPIECVQYIYREVDRLKIRSEAEQFSDRVDNALFSYKKTLELDPDNADFNHLIGIMLDIEAQFFYQIRAY